MGKRQSQMKWTSFCIYQHSQSDGACRGDGFQHGEAPCGAVDLKHTVAIAYDTNRLRRSPVRIKCPHL